MICTQEFFSAQSALLAEFGEQHGYCWQAGMNGRSGGYLVLYQGELKPSGYKSYCPRCGQKNYQEATASNNTCGVCRQPTRMNFPHTHMQVVTYPGRGTDDGEDYEDWSMYELRERVKLVQELERLADRMVDKAIHLVRHYDVAEEEFFVSQTRKGACKKRRIERSKYLICQFKKLIYPRDAALADGSYMIALYRPCEQIKDAGGRLVSEVKASAIAFPQQITCDMTSRDAGAKALNTACSSK